MRSTKAEREWLQRMGCSVPKKPTESETQKDAVKGNDTPQNFPERKGRGFDDVAGIGLVPLVTKIAIGMLCIFNLTNSN